MSQNSMQKTLSQFTAAAAILLAGNVALAKGHEKKDQPAAQQPEPRPETGPGSKPVQPEQQRE